MMSFADFGSIKSLLQLLEQHRRLAYGLLFIGAFLETLIPFSLLVLGEIVFLAGALLAGIKVLDIWLVMAALYAGGILGDNASYWLGRRFGMRLFDFLSHWPVIGRLIHRKNYQKGIDFFRQRGAFAVFIARLSGPLSWVTPALAGIFRLNYSTFLRFNTPAVIIGISEFIIIGYFFGNYLPLILFWLQHYAPAFALGIIGIIALGLIVRHYFYWHTQMERQRAEIITFISRHFGLSLIIGAIVIIGILYLIHHLTFPLKIQAASYSYNEVNRYFFVLGKAID